MYRKVVVLLDGSELAENVLPHVVEVIRGRGSHLHLITVAPLARGIDPTVVDVHASSANVPEESSRVQRELIEYLRAVAKKLEPVAADVWLAVRYGRPADEILAFVGEVGGDLIVMSTHGRSGISRWVFGTVADRVLHGATCPVLLVRAGQVRSSTPYQSILVPLDGSALAEQVLPYVKALVRSNHTRVHLISVMTAGMVDRPVTLLTSYPPGLQLAAPALQYVEAQLQAYLRSVAAALREIGAIVHVAVRQGAPADEILAYAAEVEVDLIGMTTHGLSGASRWVYGNVAGKVLQGAHCPVLLVRPTTE
jgi:nucleotide-binding universal stress UspA family protein